jgi:hypothetical protein
MTQNLPATSGKQTLETHDGKALELTPTPPPKTDLRNAEAIRRELGSVYRDMRAGRIATQDGTRFAYVLDILRKANESAVLQQRIELLERTLNLRSN